MQKLILIRGLPGSGKSTLAGLIAITTRKEMQPYFDMAEELHITPLIIECKNDFGSVHDVPTATINKMKARWEEL